MKDFELKLISELMRNSRIGDKELAETLEASLSRVVRTRRKLEKVGAIKEYTLVPDFAILGYEILAVTLVKSASTTNDQDYNKLVEEGYAPHKMKALPVLMIVRGMGLNGDIAILSVHHNYSEYTNFLNNLKNLPLSKDTMMDSFLVSLNENTPWHHLTFSLFADSIAPQRPV